MGAYLSEWYASGSAEQSLNLSFAVSKSLSLLKQEIRQQAILLSIFPFLFDATAAASVVDSSHDVMCDNLETLTTQGVLEREFSGNRLYMRYSMPSYIKEYLAGFLSNEMRSEATRKFIRHYKRVIITASFMHLQGGKIRAHVIMTDLTRKHRGYRQDRFGAVSHGDAEYRTGVTGHGGSQRGPTVIRVVGS